MLQWQTFVLFFGADEPNGRRKMKNMKNEKIESEFVSGAELATVLRCSKRSVERYRDAGMIRGVRMGPRLIRYPLAEALSKLGFDR